MVSSAASTVDQYLQELPEQRRKVVSAMRELILTNLPVGYEETVNWGMLSYEIPLSVYPNTYNKQPLSYAGLAAQKHFNSLYLMAIYSRARSYQELLEAYEEKGLKPDLGKSCLRFRRLEDLPLEKVGELIASMSPAEFIAIYEKNRVGSRH